MLDCTRRKRVEGMKNKFTCINALKPYLSLFHPEAMIEIKPRSDIEVRIGGCGSARPNNERKSQACVWLFGRKLTSVA
jgi:hypothetical protein